MLSPIQEYLEHLHARYAPLMDGTVADYIPELSKANPHWFGICIATRDGHVYEVGDTRQPFTIQSISKALAYGLALEDRGEEHVLKRIGVEPSGEAFNAISLKEGTGAPFNPMINAGAIATCGQVLHKDTQSRFERLQSYLSGIAGRDLDIDEVVYRSESETGHRNRAIGWLLRNFGILDEDPHETLETYFRQCSIRVTCRDLALMGATLANQGVQPLTRQRAVSAQYVDNILGVMATCGMYDWSGEWIYRVGLPAKSGVGGGILAVLPGQLGIGVFSPPLDAQGNSLRGIKVCMDLARELSLHMMNPTATPRTSVRLSYQGGEVMARRRLPSSARETLKTHGTQIQILELQGGLIFTTLEPVIRHAIRLSNAGCRHLIFDLRAVVTANTVSLRLLADLQKRLGTSGVEVVICQPGSLTSRLMEAGVPSSSIFSTLDAALESCEDALLVSVTGAAWRPAKALDLRECSVFQSCTNGELQILEKDLEKRTFSPGEFLIHTGESSDEMFVLTEGNVEVQITEEGGLKRRVDVLTAGMTAGEMAFLDNSPRSADVMALDKVTCLVVTRPWFTSLADTLPHLKIKLLMSLIREVSSRLRQANVEITALQRS
jgi:glutaminase